MYQLLPEVRSLMYQFGDQNKILIDSLPTNMKWDKFVKILNDLDEKVNKEKIRLINSKDENLKELFNAALFSKRNNDRSFNIFLGALATNLINIEDYIDIMLAVEIMDSEVLIIDDIIDKAERRANIAAHYRNYGQNKTIITAMLLKSEASEIILQSKYSINIKNNILQELENCHIKIYEGQLLDIIYENKSFNEITEELYLTMISLTSGSQIASGLKMGAFLGGANQGLINLLHNIGINIGIIGQIRDDLVDYLPDEDKIWKTSLLDFKDNKKRLPMIIAWQNATQAEKEKFIMLQKKEEIDYSDYLEIIEIIMKPDNISHIDQIMQKIKMDSIKLIDNSILSIESQELLNIYLSYGMSEV